MTPFERKFAIGVKLVSIVVSVVALFAGFVMLVAHIWMAPGLSDKVEYTGFVLLFISLLSMAMACLTAMLYDPDLY